ncbi:MAG: hypothetical protein GY750_03105 [Lentisphaerae bacterium]|nr:hypothetical protein [Lentisphaerota bacterium]MCP4100406.1 hypothetical protein [Lentisphaerota bacterium]
MCSVLQAAKHDSNVKKIMLATPLPSPYGKEGSVAKTVVDIKRVAREYGG